MRWEYLRHRTPGVRTVSGWSKEKATGIQQNNMHFRSHVGGAVGKMG
jgi:hypothetical protein